jgi:hypothetical protein
MDPSKRLYPNVAISPAISRRLSTRRSALSDPLRPPSPRPAVGPPSVPRGSFPDSDGPRHPRLGLRVRPHRCGQPGARTVSLDLRRPLRGLPSRPSLRPCGGLRQPQRPQSINPRSPMFRISPTRGTCRACGCTVTKPCAPTGCAWSDASHTHCTACVCACCGIPFSSRAQYSVAKRGFRLCLDTNSCVARVLSQHACDHIIALAITCNQALPARPDAPVVARQGPDLGLSEVAACAAR